MQTFLRKNAKKGDRTRQKKKKQHQYQIVDPAAIAAAAVAVRPMTEFTRLNYGLLHGYFFFFCSFVCRAL